MQPVVPDQPTYCPPVNGEHRCRDYVPHGPRKVDGQWFIVADPVDYCHGCGLAITPGAHAPRNTAASASFIMPYRIEGHLYCNRTCVPSKRRSLKIKEGASL
jgi:hypothetical protein